MSQPTPANLIEIPDVEQPGCVSAHCRFIDDGTQRLVLVDDNVAYCYDRNDKLAARQIWTQVYVSGLASYWQIANTTEYSHRSLQGWVARYRAEGAAGLGDRPRSGAPKKVTAEVRSKIYQLRTQRYSINEIAQSCTVSPSTVEKVLKQRRDALSKRQNKLPLPDDESQLKDPPMATQIPERVSNEVIDAGVSDTAQTTENSEIADPASVGGDLDITPLQESDEDSDVEPDVPPQSGPVVELATVAASPPSGSLVKVSEAEVACSPGYPDKIEAVMALDRSVDRMLARLGKLQDAEPLFAPCHRLSCAGAFLAVAVLAEDPYLRISQRFYRPFPAAFYGRRTMLITLMLMVLLRIKRPEQLRRHHVLMLGRVLGLDRTPEVKTVRRNLRHFENQGGASELMGQIAKARVADYDGEMRIIDVDGHMAAYSGKVKIGETYDPRCRRVSKGHTASWVNLPGKCPLFAVQSAFNAGLTKALPSVLEQARKVTGKKRLWCAFDRGGYNVELFEQLIKEDYDILTYRKGAYAPVPESEFKREKTLINDREYEFAPYETTVELKVYEQVDRGPEKKPGYRDTGRYLSLREIRILRPDGKQTALLTSIKTTEASAVQLAGYLFDRIGSQENVFKYMRREYDLDALPTYGDEDLDEPLQHPHPAYAELVKKATKIRQQRNRLMGKYAELLTTTDEEKAVAQLRQLRCHDKKGTGDRENDVDKLAALNLQLAELNQLLAETPAREHLTDAGYRQLKTELPQLMYTVKISAYHVETKLVDLLQGNYANCKDEGRSLIAAALHSSGSLRLEPGRIVIQLEPQAEPRRTRAINAVAAELSRRQVYYPGSRRVIAFETTEAPCPSQPSPRSAG